MKDFFARPERASAARRVILAAVSALALQGGGALAQPSAYSQSISQVAAEAPALAEFYRATDYAPLWTGEDSHARRSALFAALESAEAHGLPAPRYDVAGLKAALRDLQTERERGRLEARMSEAFLAYARDLRNGVLVPSEVDAGIVRETASVDDLALIRGIATAEPVAFLRALAPSDPRYTSLMKARLDLLRVIGDGGWGPVIEGPTLAPGDSGPEVVALRDRLIAMGYLRPTAVQGYGPEIVRAIQAFQIDHGITADGTAGEGTIAEINVSPEERLRSVTVALERMRWLHGTELGRRHIWVNLPDFTAKIIDDGRVTFETVTVVGMNQADRRSPEFSDKMEFMVINPTWNVPRSITVKEYLPMLQKNPNAAGHLRIVDRNGRLVDRAAVDFTQFTARNFPFSMSQPPSDGNALGQVKFMFPNQYNIYLHDTPQKALFGKEVRAFSHGCIRLGRPFEFAYALLARQTDNPEEVFQTSLNNRAEHPLPLEEHVPVHLVYFTAFPDQKGKVEYRRDVYGRDARIFDALQAAGVELPGVQG
jgi:L,D-transpeptidase YcbB